MGAGFLTHLLKIAAAPPGAHGAGVVSVKDLVALLELDTWVLARHDDGAGGLAGAHLGPLEGGVGSARGVVADDGRRGGVGRGDVVRIAVVRAGRVSRG